MGVYTLPVVSIFFLSTLCHHTQKNNKTNNHDNVIFASLFYEKIHILCTVRDDVICNLIIFFLIYKVSNNNPFLKQFSLWFLITKHKVINVTVIYLNEGLYRLARNVDN